MRRTIQTCRKSCGRAARAASSSRAPRPNPTESEQVVAFIRRWKNRLLKYKQKQIELNQKKTVSKNTTYNLRNSAGELSNIVTTNKSDFTESESSKSESDESEPDDSEINNPKPNNPKFNEAESDESESNKPESIESESHESEANKPESKESDSTTKPEMDSYAQLFQPSCSKMSL